MVPRRSSGDPDAHQAAAAEREFDAELGRLMDLEGRLAREQAAVESQAERVVRVARDAAEVRLRALETELEAEANRLAVLIEAERDRELARLAHEHHDQAAVFGAARGPRADALAEWVVEELLRRMGASGERRAVSAGEGP